MPTKTVRDDQEQQRLIDAGQKAVRTVENQIRQGLQSRGLKVGRWLSEVNGQYLGSVNIKPYGCPVSGSLRFNRTFRLTNAGKPIVEFSVSKYRGTPFRRRTRSDGTFPYEEVLKYLQECAEQAERSADHKRRKQAEKDRLVPQLEQMGCEMFGDACFSRVAGVRGRVHGNVISADDIKLELFLDGPEDLKKIIAALKEVWPESDEPVK